MAGTTSVIFEDWSGGDEGRSRPQASTPLIYRGMAVFSSTPTTYRGTNTWLYPAGIGPRPPIVSAGTPTGLPTGKRLRMFNFMRGQNFLWLAFAFSDGTVYSNNAGGGALSLRGTLGGFPNDSVKTSDVVYYCVESGAGGLVQADGTFTTLTDEPPAQRIEVFRSRLVVMYNVLGQPPTIRLSGNATAITDPTIWDATNSQFIGPAGLGMELYVLRDTLIIPKFDGTIWQYAGEIGFNDTLRQIDQGRVHPYVGVAEGDVVGGSVLYYVTGNQMAAFTGAQVVTAPRPDLPAPPAGFTARAQDANVGKVVQLAEDQHFLVLGTYDSDGDVTCHVPWMQSYSPERGWNRHTVPFTPYKISQAALTSPSGTSIDSARGVLVDDVIDGVVAIVVPSDDQMGTNDTVRVYLMNTLQEQPYQDRPVPWELTSNTDFRDGDSGAAVTADYQSSDWWVANGGQVVVRSVLVDYTYNSNPAIASSVSSPNHFDISIMATEPEDGTAVSESTAISFTPTLATAIDVPNDPYLKRGRELFQFGDQGPGGGFRIHLANWRGIIVKRMTVVVDITDRRN